MNELLGYERHGSRSENGRWHETLSEEDIDLYIDTIKWLIDTGYILGHINHVHDTKLTLSHKGLELLKSVPSSVDSSQTLGEQLQGAIKSGAKDYAASLVSKALSSSNLVSQIGNLFS